MPPRVRFAPSPTGRLHVGNVRTALLNWLLARRDGGSFILRIDDTDLARSTAEFEAGIDADLTWLGLEWDERFKQSERFARYDAVSDDLRARGFLYPCYETEDELDRKRKLAMARGRPPVYDRAALALSADERAALEAQGRRPHWRFKLSGARADWTDLVRGAQSIDTASLSDPVLIREDGAYLYTLCSVIDDIDSSITHIARGEDHVTNSGVQIEIFRALGAEPPLFAHFSLLIGADGEALSKRLGSLSINELRREGYDPRAIASHLAKLGTSDPIALRPDLATLAAEFAFEKMGRAPARFDPDELANLNAQILHQADYADIRPDLQRLGLDRGAAAWRAFRENIRALPELAEWNRVIDGPLAPAIDDATFCAAAADLLPEGPFGPESWGAFTQAVKEATGAKGKALFMPLRKALTGREHGPDMAQVLALIAPPIARARLRGETA